MRSSRRLKREPTDLSSSDPLQRICSPPLTQCLREMQRDISKSGGEAAEAPAIRLVSASIAATTVITAVRAAVRLRMASERRAIPSLALRALSKKASVSAGGQSDPEHDRKTRGSARHSPSLEYDDALALSQFVSNRLGWSPPSCFRESRRLRGRQR